MARPLPSQPAAALQRRLSLPLLVLYGIGITIGAGIYVLIGAEIEGRRADYLQCRDGVSAVISLSPRAVRGGRSPAVALKLMAGLLTARRSEAKAGRGWGQSEAATVTSPPWTAIPKLTIKFDKAGEKRVVDSFVERV